MYSSFKSSGKQIGVVLISKPVIIKATLHYVRDITVTLIGSALSVFAVDSDIRG